MTRVLADQPQSGGGPVRRGAPSPWADVGMCLLAPAARYIRVMFSEVSSTVPATCLICRSLPGHRKLDPKTRNVADDGGAWAPPSPVPLPERPPRFPPRPPPPRCPPPPDGPPPVESPLLALARPGPVLFCSNRCGSSLSAWLSFQVPLKSTPAGGVSASFSLAHAASKVMHRASAVRKTPGRATRGP